MNNALQTNGYLLDDAWCKFFKENQFLIGLSIDGTKQLHDMYRHDKMEIRHLIGLSLRQILWINMEWITIF